MSARGARWRVVGAVLAAGLAAAVGGPGAAQEVGLYEVLSLSTQAFAWREFSASWESLQVGAVVPEGTLVQLPAAGKLVLGGLARFPEAMPPRGIVIDADAPVIARLTPELMRRIEFGGYFASLPQMHKKGDHGESEPLLALREAWERTAALFNEKTDKPAPKTANASEIGAGGSGVESAGTKLRARELVLLVPRNGDSYLIDRLPTTVAVHWTPPDGRSRRYIVTLTYVERGGHKRILTTKESFITVDVDQVGRYSAVVESDDGRWRSPSHAFSVSKVTP